MSSTPEWIEFPVTREQSEFMVVVSREAIEDAMQRPATYEQMAQWVRENMDEIMEVVERIRPRPTRPGSRVIVRTDHING